METVKKKLWTTVFALLVVAFIFNFIYQIVLLGYQAEHTFGFYQFHDSFGSLRFCAVFGIILNVAGIGVSLFAIFGVQKGKKFGNVMIGSLLFATIPLKSAINLLTIHSSFQKITALGGEFGYYYPRTGFLTITAIISFVSVALCLLAAFLKKFKARHVLTVIALSVTVFFTVIYYPQMTYPSIYFGYGSFDFYMGPGYFILVTVGLIAAVISVALYGSLCSPKFEEKYRASAKARGIAIPNDQPASDSKVDKIKKVQEETGLGLVEAKRIVDNKEAAVKKAMEMYGMTREEAEEATGYNKPATPADQFVGMGLGLNVQQAQQGLNQSAPAASNDFDKQAMENARANTPTSIQSSGDEVADLKRQLLQGKITRAEFDEKLAEIKNQQ